MWVVLELVRFSPCNLLLLLNGFGDSIYTRMRFGEKLYVAYIIVIVNLGQVGPIKHYPGILILANILKVIPYLNELGIKFCF